MNTKIALIIVDIAVKVLDYWNNRKKIKQDKRVKKLEKELEKIKIINGDMI